MERRHNERREFTSAQEFPLMTAAGLIVKDRRRQPDRRLNNIEVTYLELAMGAFQVA
jgi:hypothetical protein